MRYRLFAPDNLHADISLPASKSISNRALILHALAQGTHRPAHLSDCDDTQVMIRALEGPQTDSPIDILAAGTAMRFLTAYFCVTPGTRVLTGTARMQQRPIGILVDALRGLGAQIDYVGTEGFPPLRITGGRLDGQEATLAGNVSSQYISALLMIGPILPQGLILHLTGEIISRPYIDLTLQLMHDFGVQAAWVSDHCIVVPPHAYADTAFTVESDWSAASYWYEIVALLARRRQMSGPAGTETSVRLPGLFARSCQGDSRGAELFDRLGVHTSFTPEGVVLSPRKEMTAQHLEADLTDMPDLAQTFVVTCCMLDIPFRFSGLQSLKIKETDRMAALTNELLKLGYPLREEQGSILQWDGSRTPAQPEPVIQTYEDHRMAMAFAPACICHPGLTVAAPMVVTKSYPHFWEDLTQTGFRIIPEP